MDLMSRMLSGMRVGATTLSKWSFYTGHGVAVQDFSPGFLLSVISGNALKFSYSGATRTLRAGDSVMALNGGVCQIAAGNNASLSPISELPWVGATKPRYDIEEQYPAAMSVQVGQGSEPTFMVGIAFTLAEQEMSALASQLPEFIFLDNNELPANNPMQGAIDVLMNDNAPGYFAIAVQLAEFAVTFAIRSFMLKTDDFPVGPLKGMRDERLAKALGKIHNDYASPLTLADLAEAATMSRSSFAAHFRATVGVSPVKYINKIRSSHAVKMFKQTSLLSDIIAHRCGFGSDRAMRTVIKANTGLTPREHRQRQRLK